MIDFFFGCCSNRSDKNKTIANMSVCQACFLIVALLCVSPNSATFPSPAVLVTPPAAIDVHGKLKLPPNPLVAQNSASRGRVILNDPKFAPILVQSDGVFLIPQLPLGSYVATIDFDDFIFPLVRLDITESRQKTRTQSEIKINSNLPSIRIRAATNDVVGNAVALLGSGDENEPLEIPAFAMHQFFIPREEFSIMSFFKNPMMIMMVVSFGMIGMMKMMPQEELKKTMKEMKEMTAKGN